MQDILTNPMVLAAVSAALYLLAKKKPALAAALKAIWDNISGGDNKKLASAETPDEVRCAVVRGIRHQISEQADPEQRAKDLALCDEFRAMLKRLSEPKAAV